MKEIRRKIQVLEDLNKIEQHCWGGNQDMKELDCGQMGAKAQKIWEKNRMIKPGTINQKLT